MRLVLLQSAIQNPESRIQNHVSALRRSQLGHRHGQAIGAGMDDSASWKTEETIIRLATVTCILKIWWLSPFTLQGGAIPKSGDFDSSIRSLPGTTCDKMVEDPRSAFNFAGKIHLPTTV